MYTVNDKNFILFSQAVEYAKTNVSFEVFLTTDHERGPVWTNPKKVSNKKMRQYLNQKAAYDAQSKIQK